MNEVRIKQSSFTRDLGPILAPIARDPARTVSDPAHDRSLLSIWLLINVTHQTLPFYFKRHGVRGIVVCRIIGRSGPTALVTVRFSSSQEAWLMTRSRISSIVQRQSNEGGCRWRNAGRIKRRDRWYRYSRSKCIGERRRCSPSHRSTERISCWKVGVGGRGRAITLIDWSHDAEVGKVWEVGP